MRLVQTSLFILAVLCLLTSVAFIGGAMGDVLWRAGVAALMTDIACILLWPSQRRGGGG